MTLSMLASTYTLLLRFDYDSLPYGSNRVPAYGRTRVSLYPIFWNAVVGSCRAARTGRLSFDEKVGVYMDL
jgi:hypothetical protein